MEIELASEILDHKLSDRDGTRMGRVDGIVLRIDGDGPPRVDRFEIGFVVLARRLHPRIETWFEAIRSRWSVRKAARQLIPWSAVEEIDLARGIKLNIEAPPTPAFAWERWLRDRVVSKIPGSGQEDEE